MVGNDLFIRGPVELHHVGQYLCQASYRRHQVSLQFTIEINPKVLLPGTIFGVIISSHCINILHSTTKDCELKCDLFYFQ